jgi:methionine-rich copper-binding protein CopC
MRRSWIFGVLASVSAIVLLPGMSYASLEASPPLLQDRPEAPDMNLVLTFPGDVDLSGTSIELIDANKRRIPIERPELSDNKTDVNVPLKAPLPPGIYTVRWRALSADGRKSQGSYNFNVDP